MMLHSPRRVKALFKSFRSTASFGSTTGAATVTCSASEALVETLVAHNIKKVFGIVGSAFIDPLDLFPAAGIEFVDVQHEQNAVHIADAYSRLARLRVSLSAGPGISNMVTGVATAYLTRACVRHHPAVRFRLHWKTRVSRTQAVAMFSNITKYQVHVENPSRISELTSLAFNRAQSENGPTQLNYSRNILNHVDYNVAGPSRRSKIVPDHDTVSDMVDLLLNAEKPVLIAGYGLKESSEVQKLAERLDTPVATTYLHNDCYQKQQARSGSTITWEARLP